MKILFFTTGPELMASSRTRVYQYLPYLHKQGIETKVIAYTPLARCKKNLELADAGFLGRVLDKLFAWRQTVRVIFSARHYDILFLQKVLLPRPALSLLKRLNDNIVFDFDDAVYLDHKFNSRFNETLSVSKYVIVENEYNKAYVEKFNPNVAIITGPIDTSRYMPKSTREDVHSEKGAVIIGWIGSPETTRYIKPLMNVFKSLAEDHKNLVIKLIGASSFAIKGVDIVIKEWRFDSELEDLQSFDIGIMPLEDDEWTRGKGGYKLLQYMAVGIPCIASPVGVNTAIIKDGVTGFLANSEKAWLDKLTILVKNKDLRRRMGEQGQLRAEEYYSCEAALPKFLDIIKASGQK